MCTIALPSVTGRNVCSMLHSSMYDNAVCVNTAIEIHMLDYNVAVHQCTVPYAARTRLKLCIARVACIRLEPHFSVYCVYYATCSIIRNVQHARWAADHFLITGQQTGAAYCSPFQWPRATACPHPSRRRRPPIRHWRRLLCYAVLSVSKLLLVWTTQFRIFLTRN